MKKYLISAGRGPTWRPLLASTTDAPFTYAAIFGVLPSFSTPCVRPIRGFNTTFRLLSIFRMSRE